MEARQILTNIYQALREDRIKFIHFCLDQGHERKDIAEVLGMTKVNLDKFIQRYIKQDREGVK